MFYGGMKKNKVMADKVQKIKEWIGKKQDGLMDANGNFRSAADEDSYNTLCSLDAYIDTLQKEPVKIKKGCKYRSIRNVTNIDTGNISFVAGKIYVAPEDDTLVSEENGWLCDLSENASNFVLVEEPASEDLEDAAEKFIQEHTRTCSNLVYKDTINGIEFNTYNEWITPDQARRAVEIARMAVDRAREETYEWLKKHSQEYVYWLDEEFGKDDMINDLKQAMKDG